jgi:hypothetical protein
MAESPTSQHTRSPDPKSLQQLNTRASNRLQRHLHHQAPPLSSQNPGGGAPKPRAYDAVQRHITETQKITQLWNTTQRATKILKKPGSQENCSRRLSRP